MAPAAGGILQSIMFSGIWYDACSTLAALALLLSPAMARAAGGAHVVDDAGVETPGICHVESFVAWSKPGTGFASLAPGCTPGFAPWLEIGGTINYAWTDGARSTLGAINLKAATDTGFWGLSAGFNATLGYDFTGKQIETTAATALVSKAIGDDVALHFNLGWQQFRSERSNDAFAGVQIEAAMSPDWTVMAEIFGRKSVRTGIQAGVRRTGRRVDVDLLYGRYVDGFSADALTLGLTVRM